MLNKNCTAYQNWYLVVLSVLTVSFFTLLTRALYSTGRHRGELGSKPWLVFVSQQEGSTAWRSSVWGMPVLLRCRLQCWTHIFCSPVPGGTCGHCYGLVTGLMGSDLVSQLHNAHIHTCDRAAVHPVTPATLTSTVLLVRLFLLLENDVDELEFQ